MHMDTDGFGHVDSILDVLLRFIMDGTIRWRHLQAIYGIIALHCILGYGDSRSQISGHFVCLRPESHPRPSEVRILY